MKPAAGPLQADVAITRDGLRSNGRGEPLEDPLATLLAAPSTLLGQPDDLPGRWLGKVSKASADGPDIGLRGGGRDGRSGHRER